MHGWSTYPIGRDNKPLQDANSKARRQHLDDLRRKEQEWIAEIKGLAAARDAERFEEAASAWEQEKKTWMLKWEQNLVDLIREKWQQESKDGVRPVAPWVSVVAPWSKETTQ